MEILIVSVNNIASAALRYRVVYPLQCQSKFLNYTLFSFFSPQTEKHLHAFGVARQLVLSLRDFVAIIPSWFLLMKKYDIVIVKNYYFPFGSAVIERVLWYWLKHSKIVFDIDDAVYLDQTSNPHVFLRYFRKVRKKVKFWLSKSDAILCSNRFIYNDLLSIDPAVKNLPSLMDITYPYQHQYFNNSLEILQSKDCKNIKLIWLGSPHTQSNLLLWETQLRDYLKINSSYILFIVGVSSQFSFLDDLPNVLKMEWSIENEIKYMKQARIGLNPLINNAFEIRKSAFKVIQYYRAGIIPFVSDVGINKEIIDQYGGCIVHDKIPTIDATNLQIHQELYRSTSNLSVESYSNRMVSFFRSLYEC